MPPNRWPAWQSTPKFAGDPFPLTDPPETTILSCVSISRVHPPAVAGAFYPGNESALRTAVDALLETANPAPPPPKALIVPHAGYIYSGSTAADGYATLAPAADRLRHLIILGPSHYVGIPAIALPDADALRTPLGDVPLWSSGVEAALNQLDVVIHAPTFAQEHSLEVQLPFIQRLFPDADVLPLACGRIPPDTVAAVLDALWGGEETAVIVSSDLSHYLPYAQARAADAQTIADILGPARLLDHDQACGATPVNGLLLAARARHLTARLISARNSGDTAGDKRRVVGYASLAFDERNAHAPE